ncbi:MAG: DUF5132 domain-containing protein [Syntrophobacteraceae bacterium]
MALFDSGFKLGTGLAIGIGVLILAPVAIPAVAAVVRPLAKAAVKSGLILVERTRELVAETQEAISDMKAEAEAELADERRQDAATPSAVEVV